MDVFSDTPHSFSSKHQVNGHSADATCRNGAWIQREAKSAGFAGLPEGLESSQMRDSSVRIAFLMTRTSSSNWAWQSRR